MSRILCAWSPHWAIANWRRRANAAERREPSPLPRVPAKTGAERERVGRGPTGRHEGNGKGPQRDLDLPAGSVEPPASALSLPSPSRFAGERTQLLALIETVRQVRRLAAVSPEAAALGLYAGQKATDAKALVPELVTADAEPQADAEALSALADWCVRFSPAVAVDPPDGLFLDITGVSHLWGGEAGMLADLRDRTRAHGLPFRLAIADTAGAAWALAHHGRGEMIAPPGGQAELLKPLPPAALRLEPEAAAQIERLGIRRLAQLVDLPRAPLGRRFGAQTLNRIDQALGRAPEALAFRRPPTPWIARLAFLEPISAPEDMARVTADVAAKLCARLETEGHGGRRFEVFFHRVDNATLPLSIGLSLPGRDARRIAKLFQPKLETIDPGFGIESVSLAAYEVEPVSGRQVRIEAGLAAAVEDGLAPLVDRLVNRLGPERVWRATPVESHVPELAVGREAPLLPSAAERGGGGPRNAVEGASAADGPWWDREAPRPVRLFRRPEPLEGVMALTPDEPPRQFQWRGRTHLVRRAEGPERIGEEWWKRDIEDVSVGHVRDYYRVEDADGARFWLFRAGLYGDPAAPPKWWLHGLCP